MYAFTYVSSASSGVVADLEPRGTKSSSGFGPLILKRKTYAVIRVQSTEITSVFNLDEETVRLAFKILQTYS